jgi:hypothetical protein
MPLPLGLPAVAPAPSSAEVAEAEVAVAATGEGLAATFSVTSAVRAALAAADAVPCEACAKMA